MATATLPAPSAPVVKHRVSTSSEPDHSVDTPDAQRRSGEKGGSRRHHDRERKIGHRRVDEAGQVTYKKKPTSELMAAMQLGIGQSITSLSVKPKRDLLLQDFSLVEQVFFPREGSNLTPAHHYSDFRFKTYAPIAFRYFRELFGIQPDDFLLSMCNEPMTELSNPGASGSIFYITDDDEFIVKTVQHSEAEFLQKLLPGYYMNLNQNPRTLLPKFYGLFCYQCGGKNIRFTIMNNLLPSTIRMHEKYDLKGSTCKRRASKHERQKKTPTFKDLDFMEIHPGGIMLEAETHTALIKTIERDCRVLQSFKIMDYSLLIGIHNLDIAAKDREQERYTEGPGGPPPGYATPDVASPTRNDLNRSISRGRSMKQRVAQYSTAMEAIHANPEPLDLDNEDIPQGGIPARNHRGERLLVFLGIIDILQNYRLRKKLEHAMKSMVHDGDSISVHRPGFYAQRFQAFFAEKVFTKIPSLDQPQVKGPHMRFKKLVQLAMKHSPTKKKSVVRPRSTTMPESGTAQIHSPPSHSSTQHGSDSEQAGAVGGRPDLLPAATPPPPFSDSPYRGPITDSHTSQHNNKLSVSGESGQDHSHTLSPAHSVSRSVTDSAPTLTEYTEGTPSYTASSPSCSSDVLDTRSVPSTSESTRKDYSQQRGSTSQLENSNHVTKASSWTGSRNSSSTRNYETAAEGSEISVRESTSGDKSGYETTVSQQDIELEFVKSQRSSGSSHSNRSSSVEHTQTHSEHTLEQHSQRVIYTHSDTSVSVNNTKRVSQKVVNTSVEHSNVGDNGKQNGESTEQQGNVSASDLENQQTNEESEMTYL